MSKRNEQYIFLTEGHRKIFFELVEVCNRDSDLLSVTYLTQTNLVTQTLIENGNYGNLNILAAPKTFY